MEILQYLDGFLVIFPFNKTKKEVDEVRKSVMADLLTHGYLPKPTEVERRDNVYCFLVVVKEPRPELLEDLIKALSRFL